MSTRWFWASRVGGWFALGWALGTLAYRVTH